jgi:hypothetical protein
VLPVIPNQLAIRGTTLTVTNTAADTNNGTLFYSLTTSPSVSATISSAGVITWKVPANQAIEDILFTTVVTNSLTTLSATNNFLVEVVPVPPPFYFYSIVQTNLGGKNGFLLSWFAPTNETFRVQETASLTPTAWNLFTNIITYTGPLTATNGLYTFFDDGSQYPFTPMRFYSLILELQAGADSLLLPNQPNDVAIVSQPISIDNAAEDSNPSVTLTYSLVEFPAPATNATISAGGLINWTPGPSDAGGAYKFTTVVMDNGVPPVSATNNFTIFVQPPPAMANTVVTSTNVTFNWTAPTNDLFQVEWTTNLTPVVWRAFPQTIVSATGSFSFTDTNRLATEKFYRLVWLPLP